MTQKPALFLLIAMSALPSKPDITTVAKYRAPIGIRPHRFLDYKTADGLLNTN